MATECAVPLISREDFKIRNQLLRNLLEQVNDGSYSPTRLHGFLSTPKSKSVGRFVPVFTYMDTAVYFACMQQLDEQLAAAAVPDTFGGWRLGGARRSLEEEEALKLLGEGSFSIPQSCYKRGAWVQNWNKFWKLLAARHRDANESAWFAMFDIANFYDSIDLRRLETSVRAVSGGAHFSVNVLFHLLRTWNKAHCLYTESTKGLPMDVVGDCSRMLANYFLTPFDRQFRKIVSDRDGHYMRFADDMVVRANSERECMDCVYNASEELHRLGLNINVAKVQYCSKADFEKYWGFVIMDRFESGDVIGGLARLKNFAENDWFGRKITALKRAVTLVSKSNDGTEMKWWKSWVREAAMREALPLQLSREQLIAYMKLFDSPAVAIEDLMPMFLEQPFSQPKAVFTRAIEHFAGSDSPRVEELTRAVIQCLSNLHDPVLDLCVRN